MTDITTGGTSHRLGAVQWKRYSLGDLFINRKEKSSSALPLLSVTRKGGVVPSSTLDRRDTSNKDKSKYLRAESGDIAYNTMRM